MFSKLISLFSDWQVKLGVLLIVFTALFAWHKHEVDLAVVKATSQMEVQYAKEKYILLQKADKTTTELLGQVEQIEKDKNAKIQNLNSRIAALTASLSTRTDRPASNDSNTGSTSNAESTEGATGLRLYRSDAVFLTRIAGEAAELQAELKACYRQYDEVKYTIDKFRSENKEKQ